MKFSACFYIKRNRNEIKIFNTAYLRKDDFFGPMRFVCFVQLLGQWGKADGEGTRNGGDKPRGTGKGD